MGLKERKATEQIDSLRSHLMATPRTQTGEQVPSRRHDTGSQANETVDGLDAATESLRHAAEDTPSGAAHDNIEKVPVFDRAGQAPKI
jgi:hypothetical protein